MFLFHTQVVHIQNDGNFIPHHAEGAVSIFLRIGIDIATREPTNRRSMRKIMLSVSAFVLTGLIAYAQTDKPAGENNAPREVKAQTVCPVDGAEINRDVFVDVKCRRIYLCRAECVRRAKANPEKYECYRNFCRDGCRDKVNADPEKYLKMLEDQGITLEEVRR